MSKVFDSERMLNHLIEIANEAVSFDDGAVQAPVGSWGIRNGAPPTTPLEAWLKTGTPATAWTRQAWNTRIFRITDYGAIGDGVTDNVDAIRACINACNAAGGGIVYVPPGEFALYRKPPPDNECFAIYNMANITFRGDGAASKLSMKGSAAGVDFNMFRLRDGSNGIRWDNIWMDGIDMTDPEPDEQHHAINFDATTGANVFNCDVYGVWFRGFEGDSVRIAANSPRTVTDIRCVANDHSLADRESRSSYVAQRQTGRIVITYNIMSGAADNEIDFEPSIQGVFDWLIYGNCIDGRGIVPQAVTIYGGGSTAPASRTLVQANIIDGGTECIDIDYCGFLGNVVTKDVDTNSFAVMYHQSYIQQCTWFANVAANLATGFNRSAFELGSDASASPLRNVVSDCVFYSVLADDCVRLESTAQFSITGCIIATTADAVTPALSTGITAVSTQTLITDISVLGCLVIGLNTLDRGVRMSASAAINAGNLRVGGCLVTGATFGFTYERQTAELYTGENYCGDNQALNVTTTVQPPADNSGLAVCGNAWRGCAIFTSAATPEGNVTGGNGSICLNTAGAVDSVFFQKVSGGYTNTGWARIGGAVFQFGVQSIGTANGTFWLAPGYDLATVNASEIGLLMPAGGVLRNFYLKCTAGVGGDSDNLYAVFRNGVQQASVIGPNTLDNDNNTATRVTVVAGDRIAVRLSKGTGIVTGQANVVFSMELV